MSLPPYVPWPEVARRLPIIFPEGTPNRLYCTRELAAKTVFSMLYIGAVEGSSILFGPKHCYRMTDEQAAISDEASRSAYAAAILKKGKSRTDGSRWYEDTTREPIRDETLQNGLVLVGAVSVLGSVATTSSKPRYALQADFAKLFDPSITGDALHTAIDRWQKANLSPAALMRTRLAIEGSAAAGDRVLVTYPNRVSRQLSPGASSVIAKSVIEVFSARFLSKPAVLWLSEPSTKVAWGDDRLAKAVGLDIAQAELLPDIILVDTGTKEPLIVFVEVIATDGAVTDKRQMALWKLTDKAGFDRKRVAFVSAYSDRENAGYRKTMSGLAWRSFAWFMSEPDKILIMRDGSTSKPLLSDLMD